MVCFVFWNEYIIGMEASFCSIGSTVYLKLNTTNLNVPLSEVIYDVKSI